MLAGAGIARILSSRITLAAGISLCLALAMSIGRARQKTLFLSNETGAIAKQPLLSSDAYSDRERIRRLNAEGPANIARLSEEMDLGNHQPPRLLANFPSVTVYSLDSKN